MKSIIIVLSALFLICSCSEKTKTKDSAEASSELTTNVEKEETDTSSKDLEKSLEQLGGLFNMGQDDTHQNDTTSVTSILSQMGGILEMSGIDPDELLADSIQQKGFSTETMLDILENSGVSRAELEKLINNPDSLRTLAQMAIKEREMQGFEKQQNELKGKNLE